MELTLVGLQHAGKTTFVNVIASGGFNEDMIPTVGFNMRKITKGNVTIKLWDIGGQPRFRYVPLAQFWCIQRSNIKPDLQQRCKSSILLKQIKNPS